MATRGDFVFLEHLIDERLLGGRALELGSYNRQGGEFGNRTFGRDTFFPYVGLGVCLRTSGA
jgi:hypothetical protein